jgi:hypothetical protein
VGGITHSINAGPARPTHHTTEGNIMKWSKPEAEVVAVTMEVTAYVATL